MILTKVAIGGLRVEVDFVTPIRENVGNDWGYTMSFTTDKELFDNAGDFVIFDSSGNVHTKGKFDKNTVIRSSWHSDKSKYSILFSKAFMLDDDRKYTLHLNFDSGSRQNLDVLLHYLDCKS